MKNNLLYFLALIMLPSLSFAQDLTDQNTKISFEVHSPWNILDGQAHEIDGNVAITKESDPDNLRADISVQKLEYSAGLSAAGRIVALWLRNNPPTPAKFTINKSSISCANEEITENPCKGTVEGKLNIWSKDYTIDVPVEIKSINNGVFLTGIKHIKWGEYGFGEPNSTLSALQPVIELNFSMQLSANKQLAAIR